MQAHSRGAGRAVAAIVAVAVLVLAGCGGGDPAVTNTPAPVESQATGSAMIDCSLLGPDDFAAAGVQGAGEPTDNPDGAGGHYCVYAGRSGATGGIEFDVFPADDVATATTTYETVVGELGGGVTPDGATFDAASFIDDGAVAGLSVRQGRLVFALTLPSAEGMEAALIELAELVVQRAGEAATP